MSTYNELSRGLEIVIFESNSLGHTTLCREEEKNFGHIIGCISGSIVLLYVASQNCFNDIDCYC